MSACTTPQQIKAARARLVQAMATMGKAEAVRSIVATALGPGSEGLCLGVKTPEARPTQAEQIDAICAKVAARNQARAA
jgi:hypothetical protein